MMRKKEGKGKKKKERKQITPGTTDLLIGVVRMILIRLFGGHKSRAFRKRIIFRYFITAPSVKFYKHVFYVDYRPLDDIIS